MSSWTGRLVGLAVLVALATGCPHRGPAGADSHLTLEADLGGLPPSTDASTTLRRSRLLRALGRQSEAKDELGKAGDAARERLDWAALSELWRELGAVELEVARPQDALEAFGKALKTASSRNDQGARARALVDTAFAFGRMSEVIPASEAASQAELLAGAELRADPLTAERLALLRDGLGNEDAAAELLAVARRGHEAAGDRAGAARAAVLLAGLRYRQKRNAAVLDEVEPLAAASPDPEARVRLLRYQAIAAYDDTKYARCEERAEQAVRLADKRGLAEVAKNARIELARCASETGHLERAVAAAQEAAMLAEEARRHLTGEQARQAAGFDAFLIYRMLLSLQVKLPADKRAAAAFDTTERARARAHLDAVMRTSAGAGAALADDSSPLLRDKEEAEARLRELTQQIARGKRDATLAQRHRDALWALEDIKEMQSQSNPLLSRIQLPRPPTLAQVRETMLANDALLVSFFVGDGQVVAIAVDKTTAKLVVLPSSPDVLGKNVRAFRKGVLLDTRRSPAEVKEAAARVYKDVLGPLDDLVKKHKDLVILPHGELSALPFEALVDDSGKFLVETHELSYGLSATLGAELAKRERPATGRKAFVAMGDPVYDWSSFKTGKAEGAALAASRGLTLWSEAMTVTGGGEDKTPKATGLTRLPGTANEVRAIAKLFGADAEVYLRDQASEENVKAGKLGGHRIVHIASHGLLESHYQALALTLNPDGKEDGFLLHSEIPELKLDADLVVLSACQTGNTRLASGSEPIAGLALALRAAGARSVVVSLWSVDDEATAKLMTEFYRPLVKEGASYGKSLAAAKRALIGRAETAHPYFWAPFVLIGD